MIRVALIVEGEGECSAVPVLIRRIAATLNPGLSLDIRPVLRVSAAKLVRPGELERSIELAARQVGKDGTILVLLDCDDGCPAKEGPALLRRAQAARSDMDISVVLAKREFEAWFLAAAESLRGCRGLPDDLQSPADPEAIRGAKEWLADRMPRTRRYAETSDQAAMCATFDMGQARRRADSFDKCYREIVRLLATNIQVAVDDTRC
ncbi:MAG TPA: DUF4276 family protein [Candidatus Latescibacteria bacterium]|nr:DUF4276 family protein [Candidatus Latescibacterota bacterium]HOS66126.1 DUF4276 family protein [Candidatus Latescibacterota bacterium]HRT29363.1 DUF4276 family protein [Kiritimatiellia bacterium]